MIVRLQRLAIVLMLAVLAMQVASWISDPKRETVERVVVKDRLVVSAADIDPDEPRIVCDGIAHSIGRKRDTTLRLSVFFRSPATARAIKERFGDRWHVWFSVPPLRESDPGDWVLTLVPRTDFCGIAPCGAH